MKLLIIAHLAVCMMSVSAGGASVQPATKSATTTTSPIPFSVTCNGNNTADVMLPSSHTLEQAVSCTLTEKNVDANDATQIHYELKSDCLSGGNFYFLQKSGDITTFDDGKIYQVICDEKDGRVVKVTMNSELGISMPAATPIVDKVSSPPEEDLDLYLLTSMPSTAHVAKSDVVTSAVLGETLYLTLRQNTTTGKGSLDLIPLSCTATATKTGSTATLWKLHSSKDGLKCFLEGAVMKSPFSPVQKNDINHRLYTAQIVAFKFTGSQSSTISISCVVRDKAVLDACPAAAPTSPPETTTSVTNRRRRREVEDSATPHGSVHHVTATLRVVNDVMAHDGSTTVTFSLACLLLAVLTKLVL